MLKFSEVQKSFPVLRPKSKLSITSLCLLVAAVAFVYKVSFVEALSPIVDIYTGRLSGIASRSRNGKEYYEFLGIPYAQPPVGVLRFKSPLPARRWGGIFAADRMGAECIQTDMLITGRVQGEEDCLTLNVFTPRLRTNTLLPVLVYIHGGFFMSGSKNIFRGKYFMDENIVLVTMNYRLGALGFLNTGDGVVRGNMGLKDQVLALQWIQNNIHNFGGDKNRVTISGESAGAACVQYHMLSPKSQGLFHRAISQSGSATRRYLLTDNPANQAKHFAMQLGCPVEIMESEEEDSSLMVSCLMRIDARNMVRVHREAISPNRNHYSIFGPTVEAVNDNDAFMTEPALPLLERGEFARVPWITGVNDGEGLLYIAQIMRESGLISKIDRDWNFLLPRLLNYNPKDEAAAWKIRKYYFGDSSRSIQNQLQNLTNLFSDKMFFSPTKKAADIHSRFAPTYLYYFTYRTPVTVYDLIRGVTPAGFLPPEIEIVGHMTRSWIESNVFRMKTGMEGACHGDELSILYNTNFFSEIGKSSKHYPFAKAFVKLWADFAKGRNNSTLKFFNIPWYPMNSSRTSKPLYLELNKPGRLIEEPFTERLKFLDSLKLYH